MPSVEMVDIVDEGDRKTGEAGLDEVLESGLIHRAVAVLVARSDGRVVLQRRSKADRWHPGLWTLSCTGHVKSRETYSEAAARELKEELGLASPLTFMSKRLLPPFEDNGLVEREWVALFTSVSDAPCTIDPGELDSVGDFDPEGLALMLDGDQLTPDARLLLEEYSRLR